MKKFLALTLAAVMGLSVAACSPSESASPDASASDAVKETDAPEVTEPNDAPVEESPDAPESQVLPMTMVTDVGGVNDESFNMLAWKGHQQAEAELGILVDYIESSQESEYAPNLETAFENGAGLIWGIGFMMAESMQAAAEKNPDTLYAVIDNNYGEGAPANIAGITFKEQEPSFMVGYIAAKMSKTGKIGFVGGMDNVVIERFEAGYVAGAKYANKDIEVLVNYVGDFNDSARGKAVAQKEMQDGADVIFHAAGATGYGVIEAVRETGLPADGGKWAIGVDTDQNKLAPDNVLTSAGKTIDEAIMVVAREYVAGEFKGGDRNLGYADDAVFFSTTGDHIPAEILAEADALVEEVKAGTLVIPGTRAEVKTFVDGL